MPNWKKVVTSGSDASLNSLTVSNGITGSLFGTASYAISASQALTASYANFALTASNSQNAQDILIYVKNVTGAQIDKGKVVRISGATGDNALIATASYESDGVSANTLGITNQDIPHDSFGYVITEGTLIGINTNAFSAGQLLYLGATGSIIGTAPVAPLHAVRSGQVLRVQQNNGSIYVRIDNGYELGELHDVVDTSTTSSYGDLLVKSGSVWINSRQLTGSYGLTGSLQATSFTGSLFGTASFASTASFVANAQTASYVLNAVSASFASTASYVLQAVSASFASTSNTQIVNNNSNNVATTAYVDSKRTKSYCFSAGYNATLAISVEEVAFCIMISASFIAVNDILELYQFHSVNNSVNAKTVSTYLSSQVETVGSTISANAKKIATITGLTGAGAQSSGLAKHYAIRSNTTMINTYNPSLSLGTDTGTIAAATVVTNIPDITGSMYFVGVVNRSNSGDTVTINSSQLKLFKSE